MSSKLFKVVLTTTIWVSNLDIDLEQICLLCALVLFSVGFGLLILLTIPQSYSLLHLGFWHFVVSLILLSASGILMAIRQFCRWRSENYLLDEWRYPSITKRTNVNSHSSSSLEPQRHRLEKSEDVPPTKEQLQAMKEILGLDRGSLQYKKRGRGLYHVVYDGGRHHWKHLGSWKELKDKLDV